MLLHNCLISLSIERLNESNESDNDDYSHEQDESIGGS